MALSERTTTNIGVSEKEIKKINRPFKRLHAVDKYIFCVSVYIYSIRNFLEGIFMIDSTVDYTKIMDALNSSMDLMTGEGVADENVIQQLSNAQQMVQQAMSYSLSRDRG